MYGHQARLIVETKASGESESNKQSAAPLDVDADIDMYAANLQKIKPIANAMKEALQKKQVERSAVHNEAMQNTLQSQDWQKRDY